VKIQINVFGMICILMILSVKTFYNIKHTHPIKYPNGAKTF